jgi:glycerophosphoryl diester phosphodiesterase
MPDIDRFPSCCGVYIIRNFGGGHYHEDEDDCISQTSLNKFLEQKEVSYKNNIAFLMAVLSEPQNERIGEVFINRKWELVKEEINPQSNRKIYIYMLNMTKIDSPQPVKRAFSDA